MLNTIMSDRIASIIMLPHMKRGYLHNRIMFLTNNVTKKLDHNNRNNQ